MSAEVIAVKLGSALIERAAALLLARRQRDDETRLSMDELIRRRIPGIRSQRSLRRQFEQISDAVAARIEPMILQEYRGLSEGELQAVSDAVVSTFEKSDLSDSAILKQDADPIRVARTIRESIPRPAGFSEAGCALYDQLIAECCDDYVRIVRHLPVFTERATSELLARISALGDEISEIIEKLPARTMYAPEGSDHDREFLNKYLELVSNTLDDVEMFSFATGEHQLRTKLSMAYISLRVATGSRLRRRSSGDSAHLLQTINDDETEQEAAEAISDEESRGGRVEAILSNESRVLLRGEAGSGKTTLLRWLAVTAARGAFVSSLTAWNGLVPVVIRLRSYGSRSLPKLDELLDDVAGPLTSIMPRGWVDRQFQQGKILLLIDGVDELPPGDRRKVKKWLQVLLTAYSEIRVVVTSRPAAASQDWLINEEFLPVSLERMTRDDLTAFVRQWHLAVASKEQNLPCPREELPEYERALLLSIKDRPHLYSLASNPLLAAMLCSLNISRYRQLPRSRMELYQIAVELLVQRRDADRQVPSSADLSLSLSERISILRDLAWRLSDNNRSELDIGKARTYVAEKVRSMRQVEVDSEDVMQYLLVRSGLLRSPAQGKIDFVHRTFQEYLAAAEIVEADRIGNLVGRAHLDLWRETVVMAAGHANRTQRHELISGILARAVDEERHRRKLRLLAVSCLETMESIEDELHSRIDAALDYLVPPRRQDDAWSLALIGEPVRQKLPVTLKDLTEASAVATVRTAALAGGSGAVQLLSSYATDSRDKVHAALVRSWPYFDDIAGYCEEVLAKIDSSMGLRLEMFKPAQWEAAKKLDRIAAASILYPTTLDKLKIADFPSPRLLMLTDLVGCNDIELLATAPSSRVVTTLILNTRRADAQLINWNRLADFERLVSLSMLGWQNIPEFNEWEIPRRVRRLALEVPKAGMGSIAVNHGILSLDVHGPGAREFVADGDFGRVSVLSLFNCDLSENLREVLNSVPKVRRLEFWNVKLPVDLSALSMLPDLIELSISECTAPDNSHISIPRNIVDNVRMSIHRTPVVAHGSGE
ncbi:NACHT domain-containing protein [Nocardia sp. NPDC005745]|uniref:NACHT domain-containing protein n=1 Tax=Nocardia sp. NPDC005745 TaxID=3157061 RepID=UPI0033C94409